MFGFGKGRKVDPERKGRAGAFYVILFLGCVGGALLASLAILSAGSTPIALILASIVIGGVGGGVTASLSGSEAMGLRIPSTEDECRRFDPGFLGDVFVGLMSAGLGMGVAGRTLKTNLFNFEASSLVELWFLDFAIAFVCGFLGLKFIKAVSRRFMAEVGEKIQGLEKDARKNRRDTTFLKAREALETKQYRLAEGLFRETIKLDAGSNIRGHVGLARAQRFCGELDRAIATLDDALRQPQRADQSERTAIALWNRACYKALSGNGTTDTGLDDILADLSRSIQIQPSFKNDLNDPDLNSIRGTAKFKALES